MSDDRTTLYKIGWLDIAAIMLTKGLWLIAVVWWNGIEIATDKLPEPPAE